MTSKERKQRYLLKKRIAKYGAEMADVDMRGRHGNHARGDTCAGHGLQWNQKTGALVRAGQVVL